MNSFTIKQAFPVGSATIYDHWLHGAKHSMMTGGKASGEAKIGTLFTAWDGYIEGVVQELEMDQRIVQSWRTADFKETDKDSQVEIQIQDTTDSCEVTLIHSQIPDGQPDYKKGWEEHYFEPMLAYFQSNQF